ncbi:MAG TPA: cobalamin-independent methionine synthase II family protein [Stellaceae bacterium]|nr:cobalamin-independent methionine synthase II family protein [Stellaceae bacterium]
MKRSTDRILTTHTGSLPRPKPLAELLMRKDRGDPYDAAALAQAVREAVLDAVRRQVETGIDIVDDGEMSKPGYSTYIADRLTGFDGHAPRKPPLDTAGYPEFNAAMTRMTGPQSLRRSTCVGPVALRDRAPIDEDVANLRAALDGTNAVEGFMTAASPGLVSAFQPNAFYPTHKAYVEAVADAMAVEYTAIHRAGFVLQLDCPDLAMAHHTGFQDLSEAEFLKRARQHVEILNHAVRDIPAEAMRLHICWGNYEGPHDHDIALAKVAPILLKAKPAALVIEAANPRHEHEWSLWREVKLPDDKLLIAGVLDTSTNYVEHPELVAERLERFAGIVGRERVIAGTDCGFGTFAGYGKIDPAIAFKKLRAMVEGAAIASRRLWAKKPAKRRTRAKTSARKTAVPARRAKSKQRKRR